ncbi:hypothetical protein [Burkholderia stabilis]|uniref:nSTAND3 domain-containing NTPase n=1 Tax=Burkholderia stabilis TaxID=95485 RepID=UPI001589043E|nr:hypothetical protein [Burkholderia stabilis]
MSIEITGPEKYRFQDRICAVIALLYAKNSAAHLEIEPNGGEDAQLIFGNGNVKRVIEVQVKGAKGKVDAAGMADWLSHFPPRAEDNPLIERLVKDPSRVALIVASGRCDDMTSAFHANLTDDISKSLDNIEIKKKQVAEIRASFKQFSKKKSTKGSIKERRNSYIDSYIEGLSDTTLKGAVQRVLIVDELREDDVSRLAKTLLLDRHGIVPDMEAVTISKLVESVAEHKRSGVNVLGPCWDIIQEARPENPLRPREYTHRGNEDALKEKLRSEYVLLLAGPPRTGKTTTAHWLAADLQQSGFSVQIKENISAASRFLLDPVEQPRVAVVDDPFGGIRVADDALHELAMLERLVQKLGKSKRLIVAQAQDRLLEVTRKPRVHDVETRGVRWVELTNVHSGFLAELWKDTCEKRDVPAWLFDVVYNALAGAELNLEPGCLIHLAYSHHRLEEGADLSSIARLAREDAQSLGRALDAEGMSPLVRALAVSTTADQGVSERELAFAMGSGGPERPGKSDAKGVGVIMGGGEVRRQEPEPQYNPVPVLAADIESLIDKLELRRIIDVADREYIFTHPQYRASAELLLDAATNLAEKNAIKLVDRCLFSLSAKTSEAAAKNLPWLYDRLDSVSGRKHVIDIARDGIGSIFLTTRDYCFRFLTKRLPDFPLQIQQELKSWVNGVTFFGIKDVIWLEGAPRVPAPGAGGIVEVDPFGKPVTEGDVAPTLRALGGGLSVVVPPEMAAKATTFFVNHPERLTVQSAGRLLSYDIAILRAPIAGAWLARPRADDEPILDRIFAEEHPAVVFEILRAVCRNWWDCSESRRELLKGRLVDMAESPIVAAALIRQLVRFDRVEHTGSPTPWKIFEALMPSVMGVLPLGAALDGPHLYNVVTEAIGKISLDSLLKIVDSWINRLQSDVAAGHTPTDFMLGVTGLLVEATTDKPDRRENRVNALLALPGTQSRTLVVANLVEHWGRLTPDERASVLGQVIADAPDSVWLQAAALTRRAVPPEVEHALLPNGLSLKAESKQLLNEMPPDLLYATVHVATGWHPGISNIGLRGQQEAWLRVINEIARTPRHALFDIAFNYVMTDAEEKDLVSLINELGPGSAQQVFELMLSRNIQTNGEFKPKAWEALFNQEPDEISVEHWIAKMADAALSVLDNLGETKEWVPPSQLDSFMAHFEEDCSVLRLLASLLKGLRQHDEGYCLEHKTKGDIAYLVSEVLKHLPPKHWSTYRYAEDSLRRMNIDEQSLLSELGSKWRQMHEVQSSPPLLKYNDLDDWVR